jgi:hypothetical protein
LRAEIAERRLRAEKSPSERLKLFASLLAEESGANFTVVGGSAIELYTGGDYVSGDIDIVTEHKRPITEVLKEWKFKDEGKLWTRAELELFVDVMEKDYSGNKRLRRDFGRFLVAAPEDLIANRLREARFWNEPEAFAQSRTLLNYVGKEGLDWEYMSFYANKEGWLDLLDALRSR